MAGHDPYAPPGVHAQAPPAGTPYGNGPTNWQVGEALAFPFRALFSDAAGVLLPVVLPVLVVFAVSIVTSLTLQGGISQFDFSPEALARQSEFSAIEVVGVVLSYIVDTLVQTWMFLGLFRFSVQLARGSLPEIGSLFAIGPAYWPVFLSQILLGIVVGIGTTALLVPAVMLGGLKLSIAIGVATALVVALALVIWVGFALTVPAIWDEKLGAIAGLQRSWELTRGHRWQMFFTFLVLGLITLGLGCTCVGLLWVWPILTLTTAFIYLRVRGEFPVLPSEVPPPQPPAGVGPGPAGQYPGAFGGGDDWGGAPPR